ncbi:MAG: MmgE/PrpD family protein [Megasphaera sp.]|jgi:2-methylcitrate dehydratase PrpD|nr:MmgE/PrpD family protein [Megasphaera sp.]
MYDNDTSKKCIDFANNFKLATVDPAVIEKTKMCVLDWLGCAICGAFTNESVYARDYVDSMGGNEQATVLGNNVRNSVYHATFANGYFGHIIEMDDVDIKSISHPGTVVIPAALSIGQWLHCSGNSLLEAIICGYEVMLRIGMAVTPAHYQIWHTTSTTGVFGSAITASKMLRLNADRMLWAFGNAGTLSSGLWEFLHDGAMSKYLHAGHAASSGVLAAYLAYNGFTGASHILEGDAGFFAGYAHQTVDYSIFDTFNQQYRILDVSFKPYPCCRHTHSAVDCAIHLHRKADFNVQQIKRITIFTYDIADKVAGNESPHNTRQAQFSIKFCVISALLHGVIKIDSFSDTCLKDKITHYLLSITDVVVDSEINKSIPNAWPSKIKIKFTDGHVMEDYVQYPKGDPENPLTWDELKTKFSLLTENIIHHDDIDTIYDMCRHMEQVSDCDTILKEVHFIDKL